MFYDVENNQIWTHEHGPRGGDEINIIEAGKNYGWPLASYGINYIVQNSQIKPLFREWKTLCTIGFLP